MSLTWGRERQKTPWNEWSLSREHFPMNMQMHFFSNFIQNKENIQINTSVFRKFLHELLVREIILDTSDLNWKFLSIWRSASLFILHNTYGSLLWQPHFIFLQECLSFIYELYLFLIQSLLYLITSLTRLCFFYWCHYSNWELFSEPFFQFYSKSHWFMNIITRRLLSFKG